MLEQAGSVTLRTRRGIQGGAEWRTAAPLPANEQRLNSSRPLRPRRRPRGGRLRSARKRYRCIGTGERSNIRREFSKENSVDIHHTEADTLDKIRPEDLRRNAAAMAFLAYVLAER